MSVTEKKKKKEKEEKEKKKKVNCHRRDGRDDIEGSKRSSRT